MGNLDLDALFKESKETVNSPEFKAKYASAFDKYTKATKPKAVKQPKSIDSDHKSGDSIFKFKSFSVTMPKDFKVDSDGHIYHEIAPDVKMDTCVFCREGILFTDMNDINVFCAFGHSMDTYDQYIDIIKRAILTTAVDLAAPDGEKKSPYYIGNNEEGTLSIDSYDKYGIYRNHGYTIRDTLDLLTYIYICALLAKITTASAIYNIDGYENMIEEFLESDEYYIMHRLCGDAFDSLSAVLSALWKFKDKE